LRGANWKGGKAPQVFRGKEERKRTSTLRHKRGNKRAKNFATGAKKRWARKTGGKKSRKKKRE